MMRRLYHWTFFLLLACTATAGAARQPVVIAAIGDSLTAGAPFYRSPLERPPDGEGDAEAPYPSWMQRNRPGWIVLNLGVSGETSDQVRARFGAALDRGPRYVVILAGANDILQNLPLRHTMQNLIYLFRTAKGQFVIPIAATLPPMDHPSSERRRRIDLLNGWIRKAAARERIPLVDFYGLLENPAQPGQLNGSPDGLHPDAGGYRQMGLAVRETIDHMEAHRPGR